MKQTSSYKEYWEERYLHGINSGGGSYGELAEFKAEIINSFIETHNIKSVIEFGCGDGNNLALYKIQSYVGYDISQKAIDICKQKFWYDAGKTFGMYSTNAFIANYQFDLVLCVDVLYHVIEDTDYLILLKDIFRSTNKFVILYTSNHYEPYIKGHIKHRNILKDLAVYQKFFKVIKVIQNRFPEKSSSVFIILEGVK